MIFLYYDSWDVPGGISTYLHALSSHLHFKKVPFQVVTSEKTPSPIADELESKGIKMYRQPFVPGDRWLVRKRLMLAWLEWQLKPGDWVFCVCHPEPALYLKLVRLVHRQKAKIAVSWLVTPEFWTLTPEIVGSYADEYRQAIFETDSVITTSKCSVPQFEQVYGYRGQVDVVPYHNLLFFPEAIALPPAHAAWKIGFAGRLDIRQKNLDTVLQAMASLRKVRRDAELHLYGGGSDRDALETLAKTLNIDDCVYFHGTYDHRHDLKNIISSCHFFIYPSRWEGLPLSILELLQAGRFCVASDVGGIPDFYAGHPESGLMVDSSSADAICQGFLQALQKLENGSIDGDQIRNRYFEGGFDIDSVHQAWTAVIH